MNPLIAVSLYWFLTYSAISLTAWLSCQRAFPRHRADILQFPERPKRDKAGHG